MADRLDQHRVQPADVIRNKNRMAMLWQRARIQHSQPVINPRIQHIPCAKHLDSESLFGGLVVSTRFDFVHFAFTSRKDNSSRLTSTTATVFTVARCSAPG